MERYIKSKLQSMESVGRKANSKARGFAILASLVLFVCLSALSKPVSDTVESTVQAYPTPRTQKQAPKYSKFDHSVRSHQKECAACHKFPSDNWSKVRIGESAFPDVTEYPKHESCLECHRPQFFKGAKPSICSICHVDPGPRNSSRHPFPNPREIFDTSVKGKNAVSEFAIAFRHDIHIEIVSRSGSSVRFENASWSSRRSEESCGVCHATYKPQGESPDEFITKPPSNIGDSFWLKKGTFKTTPRSHASCFTCHSVDAGITPAPKDCAICHKPKPTEPQSDFEIALWAKMDLGDKVVLDAWRRRDSSATFRHEWTSHAEQSCASCHNVGEMNTLNPVTKRVSVTSCNVCHITATSDDGGILNFEIDSRKKNPNFQCAKCHLGFGKMPIPESHLKAVAAAK